MTGTCGKPSVAAPLVAPNYADISCVARFTFSYVNPILSIAATRPLEENDVEWLPPNSDEAHTLASNFERTYQEVKAFYTPRSGGTKPRRPWTTITGITLLQLNWWPMVLESIWVLVEVGQRLGTPVALRQFLRWLQAYAANEGPPQWQGWVWAVVLGVCGYSMVIIHHQLFWFGMRMGFNMRQQTVSAIHAKVLRLNSAAVSALSTGHVVNLVSNDVRRFDDAMPFWIFIWAAPLELAMVLLMVSLELDFPSALAGVATSLAIIPVQSALVRYIGGLRRNTARCTDERVRLAGEVVEGVLAMKMLGWEDPFADALRAIRCRETSFSRRMQRIRGINFAMQFCITPIVSFVTFAVFRARNGSLNVASVFYSLSLLHLPKLYMVNFFVLAVQTLTELRVSLQRIDSFLATPEPTRPGQQRHHHHCHDDGAGRSHQTQNRSSCEHKAAPNGGRCSADLGAHGAQGQGQPHSITDAIRRSLELVRGRSSAKRRGGEAAPEAAPEAAHPEGYVAMCGADYDWARPFGRDDVQVKDTHGTALGMGRTKDEGEKKATGAAAPSGSGALTLCGVNIAAAPGELVGICGAVGSGKSSLLAALLGELQPLERSGLMEMAAAAAGADATDGVARSDGVRSRNDGGPIVRGRVAYCAQVPWIVAGSVRENILFGTPWEEKWYTRVVHACCLMDDFATLPAGDQTELGERGINLSGGQKARVALARACYARPAVALLDDPLSAVDPRVGRDLFARAIGPDGLLAECGSTRLLVTHQRQYLPKCNRLVVLREGQVVAEGPWRQVVAEGPWRQVVGLRLPELTAGHGGMAGAGPEAGTEAGTEAGQDAEVEEEGPSVDEALDGLAAAAQTLEPASVQPSTDAAAESSAASSSDVAVELCGIKQDESSQELTRAEAPAARGEVSLALEGANSVRGGEPAKGGGKAPAAAAAAGGAAQDPSGSPAISSLRRARSPEPGALAGERSWLALARTLTTGSQKLRLRQLGSDSKSVSPQREDRGTLVQSEDRVTGTVSWLVYGNYCRHLGLLATGLIMAALIAGQAVFLASEWWLALWSRADSEDQGRITWLWVYGMLTGIVIILAFLRSAIFFETTLSAATSIHNAMARRVLRAPLSFFHTNPSGRIVNRFSKDQGQVDDLLPSCLFDALQSAFQVLGAFVLVAIAVPVILPVFLPLAAAFYWIRRRYITASRDIKRWEAITRSPIFASFSATLKGLPTIRAYGAADRFDDAFLTLLSHNGNWYFAFISTSRWIGVRLDAVAGTALLAAAVLAMAMRDRINTGVMALALTHVLQLTGLMQWVVRQTAEVENTMTSVERMLAYTQLPSEPPRVAEGGGTPPPAWPKSGALIYQDVTAVYRPGLPPVLRNLSFSLAPGTSCGVVGRTGSGKSSLMLTLFRLIDVVQGRILLDGVDTAGLGLDALRRQLAIIPQDPVLFSGTLRSNLDPWGAHSDDALWEVLQAVQLRAAVSAMPGGLDAAMAECGGNLSVGQRQLFCLARALLQDAKVLALDEATANVDRATDQLIQNALRDFAHRDRETHGRVLLVIAHRIDTILDTDHLLVLSAGQLVESGRPEELAAGDGVFAKMVTAAKLAGAAQGVGTVPNPVKPTTDSA